MNKISLFVMCKLLVLVQSPFSDKPQWRESKMEILYWDKLKIKTIICPAEPESTVYIWHKSDFGEDVISLFGVAEMNNCELYIKGFNSDTKVTSPTECWRSSNGSIFFVVKRTGPEQAYICDYDDYVSRLFLVKGGKTFKLEDSRPNYDTFSDPSAGPSFLTYSLKFHRDLNTAPNTAPTPHPTVPPPTTLTTPLTTAKDVDDEQAAVVGYKVATIALSTVPGVVGIIAAVKAVLWISKNGLPKCSTECLNQCLSWFPCFRQRVVINIGLNTKDQQEKENKTSDRKTDVEHVDCNEIFEEIMTVDS